MKMEDSPIAAQVTTVVCPVTFVKTKAALDELEDGQVPEVRRPVLSSYQRCVETRRNAPSKHDGTFHRGTTQHSVEARCNVPLRRDAALRRVSHPDRRQALLYASEALQ
jgi:hypothetical protein